MDLTEDERWLEEFLKWVVANTGLVESTNEAYGRDLRSFCNWLQSHDVTLTVATEDQIVSYVGHIRDLGYQIFQLLKCMEKNGLKRRIHFLQIVQKLELQ